MKDIIEHIRSVHFALTASCVAIIIAYFFLDNSKVTQASADMAAIRQLTASWDQYMVSSIMYPKVKSSNLIPNNTISAGDLYRPIKLTVLESPESKRIFGDMKPSPIYVHPPSEPHLWRLKKPADPNQANLASINIFEIGRPVKLSEFVSLWDSVQGGVMLEYLTGITGAGHLYLYGNSSATTPIASIPLVVESVENSFGSEVLIAPYLDWTDEKRFSRGRTSALLVHHANAYECKNIFNKAITGCSGAKIEVHSNFSYEIIDVQRLMAIKANKSWQGGAFEDSFSFLNDFIGKASSVAIIEADAILENIKGLIDAKVSIFGVDVPAKGVNIALFVIVIVQLYLWLHIDSLIQQSSFALKQDSTPWIGRYTHPFAKTITIISSCLLPLFTIIYGRLHNISDLTVGGWCLTVGISLLSLIAFIMTYSSLKRLWYLLTTENTLSLESPGQSNTNE